MKYILAISLLFCLLSSQSLKAEVITFVTIDYCPYQCLPQKEGGKLGYMTDIIKIIFEAKDYTVRFVHAPFKRAVLGTERGEYDGVLNVNTKHSKLLLLSKETSGILQQNFYVKKGIPWRFNGIKSLENIIVGSVIGYNYSAFNPQYEQYLQDNRKGYKVQYVGGDDASLKNFKKILANRITTFNEDKALFEYVTSQAGIKEEFEIAGTLGENIQYVGFSPKNQNSPRAITIYDNGIKQLRENGTLNRILEKYGLQDWLK